MAELLSVVAFLMAIGAVFGVIAVGKKADAGASAIVNSQMIGVKKLITDHQTAVKGAVNTLNKRLEKLEKNYQSARSSQSRARDTLAGLESRNKDAGQGTSQPAAAKGPDAETGTG